MPNSKRIGALVGPTIMAMVASAFPLVQPHLHDAQIPLRAGFPGGAAVGSWTNWSVSSAEDRPMRHATLLIRLLAGSLALTPASVQPPQAPGPIVYTVAPSASTKREAQRIIRLCRWTDTSVVADADRLLVVVRSSRSQPMEPSYDNLKWLRDEAVSQLNDSGAQFHVYFYSLTSAGRLVQESHRSYDVPDAGAIPDPSARAQAAMNSGLNCQL